MDLNNKTIVITGASSGIGEAAAKRLAGMGGKLMLVARRQAELDRVAEAIIAAGGSAVSVVADLASDEGVNACAEQILAEHGPVDILINNAGRSIRRSVRNSLDRYHDFQRTMQLNYFAAVNLTLKFLPGMLERGSGHIINVSSMSALIPTPRYAAYVGSKSALDGFSRCLAAELVDAGVKVTTINYPLVRTPMSSQTAIYKNFRMMDVDEAAEWIVKAVDKQPQRIASRLGEAWGAATTLVPGPTVKWTGRLFNYMSKRLQAKTESSA